MTTVPSYGMHNSGKDHATNKVQNTVPKALWSWSNVDGGGAKAISVATTTRNKFWCDDSRYLSKFKRHGPKVASKPEHQAKGLRRQESKSRNHQKWTSP
ncbi:hypothetical protein PVK06_005217 [Gossypium arboreum]|uniref:Uncharacterized protein n=1 Tax=Gossypium arboreum TaxID=29729 RepID=A0ABR0QU24_GOSAR|nr:hypothetical protein PVK06_005217 [Gossypium arboreum]